jgi:hypothetical protein
MSLCLSAFLPGVIFPIISYSLGILLMNSSSFSIFEVVFVLHLILKDIFSECRILVQNFFNSLKILLHYLLTCIVSDEISAVILLLFFLPLYH